MYNGRKFSEVSISDKRNIHKLKLTNYNVIIKIGKQDLIDIKKNNKRVPKPYNLSTKKVM